MYGKFTRGYSQLKVFLILENSYTWDFLKRFPELNKCPIEVFVSVFWLDTRKTIAMFVQF